MLGWTHFLQTSGSLPYDVGETWLPFVNAVLDGVPIYLHPAIDNKPPLFSFIGILAGMTGHYVLVIVSLTALANAATATLLYQFVSDTRTQVAGVVAAGLFLAALPIVSGTRIGPRPLALPLLFLALTVRSPLVSGVSVASAVLLIQYAAFAIPIIAWNRFRISEGRWRELTQFCIGGTACGGLVFATVWLIWGQESFLGSLYWSFGSAVDYTLGTPPPKRAEDWWYITVRPHTILGIQWPLPGESDMVRPRPVRDWGLAALLRYPDESDWPLGLAPRHGIDGARPFATAFHPVIPSVLDTPAAIPRSHSEPVTHRVRLIEPYSHRHPPRTSRYHCRRRSP